MSKPSLSPEQLKQLERDAIDNWVGKTQKEALDHLVEAGRAQERGEDELIPPLVMFATYFRDLPGGFPKGRPQKTDEQRAQPSQEDRIRADYRALRDKGKSRDEAINILASKDHYNKQRDTIENAINRKSTRK